MLIRPRTDLLICGAHCPRGASIDAPENVARDLIAQRLCDPVQDPVPEIERAEARPVVETATARRKSRIQ